MTIDDSFAFSCNLCGNCCRWDAGGGVSDNLLSGADIIKMAAHLGMTPGAFAGRYGCAVYDPALKLRVIKLKKNPDGSCILLREGRCIAYPARPRTCALFPLVRGYSFALDDGGLASIAEEYFSLSSPAPAHECGCDKLLRVREWLEQNGAPISDEADRRWYTKLWRHYTQAIDIPLSDELLNLAFNDLYKFIY